MATQLMAYLQDRQCKEFRARPQYFRAGDHVAFFFSEERAYEERVDELLTIYRSMKTHEMVGCKIKGVKRLLGEMGRFGVVVQDGKVTLGMLFVTAAFLTECREKFPYQELATRYGSTPVDAKELAAAA